MMRTRRPTRPARRLDIRRIVSVAELRLPQIKAPPHAAALARRQRRSALEGPRRTPGRTTFHGSDQRTVRQLGTGSGLRPPIARGHRVKGPPEYSVACRAAA